MRLPLLRTALSRSGVLLAVLALGACSFEPRYPIAAGDAPGRGVVMTQPAYPIDQPPPAVAAAPPPRYAPPVSDEPAAASHPRPPVDSTDLPAPRAEADFGAPRLMSAMAYAEDAPRLVLARARQHSLRNKIEADEDAPAEKPSKRRGHAKAKTAEADAPDSVTVGKGDTLYSLSRRAHATVDEVAKLNGLKPPYALTPGRTLKLPGTKTSGMKSSAKETGAADDQTVAAPKSARERRKAAADAADAVETAKAACPRHRGRKACLARAEKTAGAEAAPSDAEDPAAALSAAKAACPKHRGRKACLAKAEKQAATAAKPTRPSAADSAAAVRAAKAGCPRHRGRNACLAKAEKAAAGASDDEGVARPDADAAKALAAAAKAACPKYRGRKACLAKAEKEASAKTAAKPDADAAKALSAAKAACPKHRGRNACLAKAETTAAASDDKAARKQAADAATTALNMKACRKRHSRKICLAEAAEAQETEAASLTPRKDWRRPAAIVPPPIALPPVPAPRATDSGGSSAADIVASASLPSTATTGPVPRRPAESGVAASPGPRPYASVFGSGATVAPSRRGGRDRSARTSEDAQLAAAAAAKRGYARATIPPVVMPVAPSADGAGRPRFAWPVNGEVLSGFGPKGSGLRNDGLDLAAQTGDPVKASAAGEVVYAGGAIPGFGNLVLVKHAGGYVTAYGHLSRITVAMKQIVRQGDVVGEAGQSGNVDRPEVHFEIRYAGSPDESAKPVDPAPLLPRRG